MLTAIFITNPRATHTVIAGDLVAAGTKFLVIAAPQILALKKLQFNNNLITIILPNCIWLQSTRKTQGNKMLFKVQYILDYPAMLGNLFPKSWPDTNLAG